MIARRPESLDACKPHPCIHSSGERWYTVSSPELAREVLLPKDDTYVDRFIPGPMTKVCAFPRMLAHACVQSAAYFDHIGTRYLECGYQLPNVFDH